MRLVGRQLAPLRDIFTSDGAEIGLIVDVHTRQIRAVRNREPVELDAVLDAHFRILEERFALSVGQTWATMFGRRRRRPPRPFEPRGKSSQASVTAIAPRRGSSRRGSAVATRRRVELWS
jgi:hypothetical protein